MPKDQPSCLSQNRKKSSKGFAPCWPGKSPGTHIATGLGMGLRQHHTDAGVTVCAGCHVDADPENYTPVGEDVLPNYYANPGTGHPGIPTDSCNPSGGENFAGTAGLDNDGDGIYDTIDSDCGTIVTYTVGGNVSGLSGSGLVLQNNAVDDLPISANGGFVFSTALADGSGYAVTVLTQPHLANQIQ